MAEAAITALLSGNDAAHNLFPMELIIRESCGAWTTEVIAHSTADDEWTIHR